MRFLIGMIVTMGCIFGGFAEEGGNFHALWVPIEFIIILGSAIGAFIVANAGGVIKGALSSFSYLFSGPKKKKQDYIDLLLSMYKLFKLAKDKGNLAIEAHIESPEESDLLKDNAVLLKDHHALHFMCDTLRLLTLGVNNPNEMGDILDIEIDNHHHHDHLITHALQAIADGLPALGIVACVLGVVNTMSFLTEPPEVLGHMIGAALVGTFFGVLMAYGVFAPMKGAMEQAMHDDSYYFSLIKVAIIAHMQGYNPSVSTEFARKSIGCGGQPSFNELDEAIQAL